MEFEMTVAPSYPPVHRYDPGKNPMELVDTPSGKMERWRADALLMGETSALTRVRDDSIAMISNISAREEALAAGEAELAEQKHAFALSVSNFVEFVGQAFALFDKLEKLRVDQEREPEEPLAAPPGEQSNGEQSREPEPSLELEGDNIAGTSEDPDDPVTAEDQTEFPDPELPHPPIVQPPIAAGLDADIKEE
jgi:hypothetical protein